MFQHVLKIHDEHSFTTVLHPVATCGHANYDNGLMSQLKIMYALPIMDYSHTH